ncbi:MAG: hypothetical protein ACR2N1_19200, partial [Rubripirellula sp.]
EKRKKAGRASTRRASGLKVNPDFSPIRFDLWTHCILHQVTIFRDHGLRWCVRSLPPWHPACGKRANPCAGL